MNRVRVGVYDLVVHVDDVRASLSLRLSRSLRACRTVVVGSKSD